MYICCGYLFLWWCFLPTWCPSFFKTIRRMMWVSREREFQIFFHKNILQQHFCLMFLVSIAPELSKLNNLPNHANRRKETRYVGGLGFFICIGQNLSKFFLKPFVSFAERMKGKAISTWVSQSGSLCLLCFPKIYLSHLIIYDHTQQGPVQLRNEICTQHNATEFHMHFYELLYSNACAFPERLLCKVFW